MHEYVEMPIFMRTELFLRMQMALSKFSHDFLIKYFCTHIYFIVSK